MAADPSNSIVVVSGDFRNGGQIPLKYVCRTMGGDNYNPSIAWSEVPDAESYALVAYNKDPDGSSKFEIIWVLSFIPSSVRSIDSYVSSKLSRLNGMIQGRNHTGDRGYQGPCVGKLGFKQSRRYVFQIIALDTIITEENLSVDRLNSLMDGHIIEKGMIMGRFP